MRVLVLTSTNRLPDFTMLYRALGLLLNIKVLVLDKKMQSNLRKTLLSEHLADYDRVVLDLLFKYVYRQGRFLSGIPGLLIYEEDACQNYLGDSRWQGAFSKFYRNLPQAKVMVTSASVAARLQGEGFDAKFFPKVYDSSRVFFEAKTRDIELGFIGRTASAAYTGRRELLEQLARLEPLQLLRTEPGEHYRTTLNRIRYFVSADVGLSEYMAKNFEAMACGCVLLAWRQRTEESVIGLNEREHVLLYNNLYELRDHLALLRSSPHLAQEIADNGRRFVESNLTFSHLAAFMETVLTESWTVPQSRSGWQRFKQLLGHRV